MLYIISYVCGEGQITHLFFPGRVGRGYGPDWTLAVVSPTPRRQDLVSRLVGKIDKILVEMGLGGSVWVDIEGIRSHMGYKGSGIPKRDLVCYNISKYFWTVGLDKCRAKNSKNIKSLEVAYGYQKA